MGAQKFTELLVMGRGGKGRGDLEGGERGQTPKLKPRTTPTPNK